MVSTIPIEEQKVIREKTAKPLLWIAMAGMSMIFISLTSAYIVRQADSDWLTLELPSVFYISTAIIIVSSITLWFADISAKKNNQLGIKLGLGLTFLLSLAFVVSQFAAYGALVDNGMNLVGSGIASSFLYILTFVHLAHVFGGNITLLITFSQSIRNKYSASDKLGIELASWYWHYLTGVWMFLLFFLLYIK